MHLCRLDQFICDSARICLLRQRRLCIVGGPGVALDNVQRAQNILQCRVRLKFGSLCFRGPSLSIAACDWNASGTAVACMHRDVAATGACAAAATAPQNRIFVCTGQHLQAPAAIILSPCPGVEASTPSLCNCAFTYSNTKLQCSSRACSCCQHFSHQISKGRFSHRPHRRLRLVRLWLMAVGAFKPFVAGQNRGAQTPSMSLLPSELYCFHSPFLWTPSSSATGPMKSSGAQVALQPQQQYTCYQNLRVTIVRRLKSSSENFAGVLLPQFSSREKELLRGSIDFIGCRYPSPSSAAESSHQCSQVSTTTRPALSLSPPPLPRPRPKATMATVGAILAPLTGCELPSSVLNLSYYFVAYAPVQ